MSQKKKVLFDAVRKACGQSCVLDPFTALKASPSCGDEPDQK